MSANIALLNQCLPQTDTFLKAAITTIPDVPPIMEADKVEYKRVHSEARLASFLRMFWSTLVIVPGHPEHGPFYLVQVRVLTVTFEWLRRDPMRHAITTTISTRSISSR